MNKSKELESRQFVVKSNSLVEARYRLSLQESHVVLWLLMQIKPEDEDFKEHHLKVDEFSKMISLEAQGQYGELQKVTENLMRRILKIIVPETGDLLQVAWLSSARYQKKKGNILLRFDPSLKPYLLQLKSCFTKIDLVDTLKLKSIYSVRVFELLKQYLSIGKRKISIEDLRAYCGIEKDEYERYFDLKRKVINRAKTEINAKTDYEVDYREIKESRKVVTIEWTIKSNKKSPIKISNDSKSYLDKSTEENKFSLQEIETEIKNSSEDESIKTLRAALLKKLGTDTYISWFRNLLIKVEMEEVIIYPCSNFVKDRITRVFLEDVEEVVNDIFPKNSVRISWPA